MGAAAFLVAAAVATPVAAIHAQSSPSTFRSTESEAQVATPQLPQETRASRSEPQRPNLSTAFLAGVKHELALMQRLHDRQVALAAAKQRRLIAARAAKARQAQQAQMARLASGSSVKSYAMSQLPRYGWSSSQFGCLDKLWTRESEWKYTAANPSGAYGIPQALPGSKMASAGADWRTNPFTQIRWGLGYIKGLYHTPCAALAHSDAYNYY